MKKIFLFFLLFPFSLIAQPSLDQQIAQMVMVGFSNEGASYDTLQHDIQHKNLGGVLLFAYNIPNRFQIVDITDELQEWGKERLFIATDQEGGRVARLNESNGYTSTLSAFALGTTLNDETRTRAQAKTMAGWLSRAGINVNFAPVVDLDVNRNSPAIGRLNRSFSADPFIVTDHATWFMDEFHQQHIATSTKHFPGHGSAVDDSHLGFTDISNTWTSDELIPYEDLIESGYSDMVMTGHLYLESWDDTYPASLSEYAVTTMLRDSLGFQGVVITDELFMRAISDNFGLKEAIVQTIKAGTDILLFNYNLYQDKSLTGFVVETVKTAIANGELSEERIATSYDRIMTLKEKRILTSNEESVLAEIPTSIKLQNYPNPFNPSTTFEIALPQRSQATLVIYSTLGQRISTLFEGTLSNGTHQFTFNASTLSSGLYLAVLETPSQRVERKIMLIK